MGILNNLTTISGDKMGNYRAADLCLADPALLAEIESGSRAKDGKTVADCAEVFTEVAKQKPELVVPYAASVIALTRHKNNRARWEGMHALALIAGLIPDQIEGLLPQLQETILHNESVIVRDGAVDSVANYAASSPEAARRAYPILVQALHVWDSHHAGHALRGLANIFGQVPELAAEIQAHAEEFSSHKSGAIQKEARRLVKLAATK